jgi:hypothetical protein
MINIFAFLEIELYYEYKQNPANIPSAETRTESHQDRTQPYSRISSSKTYVTEVTEKSSLWESSTAVSRAPTSFVFLFEFHFFLND